VVEVVVVVWCVVWFGFGFEVEVGFGFGFEVMVAMLSKKLDKVTMIRASATELRAWKRAAKARGISLAAWIRDAAAKQLEADHGYG
jgi:hypothetical protein